MIHALLCIAFCMFLSLQRLISSTLPRTEWESFFFTPEVVSPVPLPLLGFHLAYFLLQAKLSFLQLEERLSTPILEATAGTVWYRALCDALCGPFCIAEG